MASNNTTGMPTLTKLMVIPPPIVPAPMMPTESTARALVPSGIPAIFAAARSAAKTWRSARDSGVFMSDRNDSRSSFMPSSNDFKYEAATASTHFIGAGKFFTVAATVFFANCRNASGCASRTLRSRTRFSTRFSATTFSAKATAAATKSPSTISSISGVPLNFTAAT